MKSIRVRGKPVAGGRLPLVCTPLVARTRKKLLAEAAMAKRARPDVVEWRADFYAGVSSADEVVEAARALKRRLGATPLLFTCRAAKEGGHPTGLGASAVALLYERLCAEGCVDLVDFEMSNDLKHIRRVRAASRMHGATLILSYHDFRRTRTLRELTQRFSRAKRLGADVAKVAVMPRGTEDVVTLLGATLQSSRELGIPLISMSMGATGCLTRIIGWAFGSSLTFGVASASSAPGQLPVAELRRLIGVTRKALGRG